MAGANGDPESVNRTTDSGASNGALWRQGCFKRGEVEEVVQDHPWRRWKRREERAPPANSPTQALATPTAPPARQRQQHSMTCKRCTCVWCGQAPSRRLSCRSRAPLPPSGHARESQKHFPHVPHVPHGLGSCGKTRVRLVIPAHCDDLDRRAPWSRLTRPVREPPRPSSRSAVFGETPCSDSTSLQDDEPSLMRKSFNEAGLQCSL